ncbi:MAG: hypothetical protein Crog4KO_06240 [Crocinitomicaceae bacterium]
MTREERAVAIAGLTFFLFGLSIFMRDGSFVSPWPLNEFLVLAVSFLFVVWHFRSGVLPYLFFASALAGVLGSYVFWETVLSVQEFHHFFLNYTVVDWARITSALFLVAAMFVFLSSYRKWYLKGMVAIAIGLYAWGFVFDLLNYMLGAFLFLTVISVVRPIRQPFQLLWILYFVLFAMQWVTVHYA